MIYDSVPEVFSERLLQALLILLEISSETKNTLILKELCVDYNMNHLDFVLSNTLKPLAHFFLALEDTPFDQCVICLALETSSKTVFSKREMMVHFCVHHLMNTCSWHSTLTSHYQNNKMKHQNMNHDYRECQTEHAHTCSQSQDISVTLGLLQAYNELD